MITIRECPIVFPCQCFMHGQKVLIKCFCAFRGEKALKNVFLQVFEMYHSGIVSGFQLKQIKAMYAQFIFPASNLLLKRNLIILKYIDIPWF